MIDDLKPYSKMKDSGVPWLGEVPEHWEVRRLRNAAEMRVSNVDKHTKDDEHPVRLCNYVDVYKNDRIRSGMTFMRATATREEIERFRLRAGDVLITKDSESWNDIGVPALVEEADDDLISGYHLALLRPFAGHVDGGYLFRAMQSTGVAYQFHVEANGVTRYGLSHSAIRSTWLPLPPLPEQAAIVRFLDHADRRIRRYIRAKQKLIKLLEERVAARASQVMRHPRCTRQRLGRVATEHVRSIEREDAETYVALGLYNRGRGIFHKRPTLGAELGDSTFSWVEPDDLVISGQFAWEGAVALASSAEKKTIVSHRYYVLRGVTDRATTPYLWALLRSDFGAMLLDQHSRGAAGRNRPLNLRTLLKEPVPVPPFEAQLSVDELLAANGPLHAQATRQINLLREFRTRLISAVVTGKLDVREAAARLPREPEDLELLDESEVGSEAQEAGAGDADDEVEEVAA